MVPSLLLVICLSSTIYLFINSIKVSRKASCFLQNLFETQEQDICRSEDATEV